MTTKGNCPARKKLAFALCVHVFRILEYRIQKILE